MKKVYDVIIQLQKVSGSNAKISILRDNEDNVELMKYLFFTYEPTISYYQKQVDTSKTMFPVDKCEFSVGLISEIHKKLHGRQLSGNAAISWLNSIYNGFANDWERDLLVWFIGRDIRAGVSDTTINKIWSGLLTHEPYMRCSLPKDVELEAWPWEEGVDSEIKYDGQFADYKIYKNGQVKIQSRSGQELPIDLFEESTYDLQDICMDYFYELFPKEEYIVFNGEFEVLDKDGNVLPREQGNGIMNSILKTGQNKYEDTTPIYTIWDFIPGSKFEAGEFRMPRKERRAHIAKAIAGERSRIKLAERKVCYSYDQAVDEYHDARLKKLEGTIIKHPDGFWFDGDSKHQIKMKEEKPVDLVVVGFKEGKGKDKGSLGSIICQSSDGLLEVNVSGFKDWEERDIWDNRKYYLGKILEVKSNGVMVAKKKTDKHSLFLGRCGKIIIDGAEQANWRLDKTQADSYARIVEIFTPSKKDKKKD